MTNYADVEDSPLAFAFSRTKNGPMRLSFQTPKGRRSLAEADFVCQARVIGSYRAFPAGCGLKNDTTRTALFGLAVVSVSCKRRLWDILGSRFKLRRRHP